MGFDLFRDRVVRSDKYAIQSQLISAMLTQIHLERMGEVIDRTAINSAVIMLSELHDVPTKESVYVVDFESRYLEKSTSFYQIESQKLASSCDAPEFMRRVSKLRFIFYIWGHTCIDERYNRWNSDWKRNMNEPLDAWACRPNRRSGISSRHNWLPII